MTTRAAEGLPRRCWTIAEIERMVSAGIIDEKERLEHARPRVTRIHRKPGADGYGRVADLPGGALLAPLLVPIPAVRLHDLGLLPLLEGAEEA